MPALTGNTALDVALGLSFVYLLFSVLCAAAQEAIAVILDWRAAMLEQGLRNLLDDDGKKSTGGAPTAVSKVPGPSPGSALETPETGKDWALNSLTDQVLGHGLIRTTYRDAGRFLRLFGRSRRGPSYIDPRTFALALLNVVAPANADDPIDEVRKEIGESTWIPAGTRSALVSLASGAAKDRDQLRTEIEIWFNAAMARVSGWYKRKTQVVICVLSLIVAIGLNVNTVSIAQRLINDDTLRTAVAQQAVNTGVKANESLNTVANQIGQVQKLGLPFGWNKKAGDPAQANFSHHLGRTLVGWLLTFLALSLGAPFWFDSLSKLAGLRGTGSPPETSAAGGGSG